jgi:hypothetical protein
MTSKIVTFKNLSDEEERRIKDLYYDSLNKLPEAIIEQLMLSFPSANVDVKLKEDFHTILLSGDVDEDKEKQKIEDFVGGIIDGFNYGLKNRFEADLGEADLGEAEMDGSKHRKRRSPKKRKASPKKKKSHKKKNSHKKKKSTKH